MHSDTNTDKQLQQRQFTNSSTYIHIHFTLTHHNNLTSWWRLSMTMKDKCKCHLRSWLYSPPVHYQCCPSSNCQHLWVSQIADTVWLTNASTINKHGSIYGWHRSFLHNLLLLSLTKRFLNEDNQSTDSFILHIFWSWIMCSVVHHFPCTNNKASLFFSSPRLHTKYLTSASIRPQNINKSL